jgi:hypothetical protein
MRIALNHQALRLGTDLVATELPPGDEELLLRRLAALWDLVGQVGDLRELLTSGSAIQGSAG